MYANELPLPEYSTLGGLCPPTEVALSIKIKTKTKKVEKTTAKPFNHSTCVDPF